MAPNAGNNFSRKLRMKKCKVLVRNVPMIPIVPDRDEIFSYLKLRSRQVMRTNPSKRSVHISGDSIQVIKSSPPSVEAKVITDTTGGKVGRAARSIRNTGREQRSQVTREKRNDPIQMPQPVMEGEPRGKRKRELSPLIAAEKRLLRPRPIKEELKASPPAKRRIVPSKRNNSPIQTTQPVMEGESTVKSERDSSPLIAAEKRLLRPRPIKEELKASPPAKRRIVPVPSKRINPFALESFQILRKPGKIAFASVRGYRPWPCAVLGKDGWKVHVRFFATNETATVDGSNVYIYCAETVDLLGTRMTSNRSLSTNFNVALDIAAQAYQRHF